MEFKRPNRQNSGQPKPAPPAHSDTSANPQPKRQTKIRRILLSKKAIIVLSTLLVVIIAGLLIRHYLSANAPGYKTVLPGGKSVDELGGWKRVSPPEKPPVFAYEDKINNVPISVSQQPLPDSFKSDTASHIAELAKSYSATTKLTAGETTVYIGTSTKGPQSVIFTQKNLLILIKSQNKIENTQWEEYVKSLDGSSSGRIPKY